MPQRPALGSVSMLCVVLFVLSAPRPAQGQEESAAYRESLDQGIDLLARQDFGRAIEAFKSAEGVAGGPTVDSALGLAAAYNHIGAFGDSAEHARQAIELASTPRFRALAYHHLGMALLAEGSFASLEEAVAAFQQALELTDGEANNARFNLGTALLKLGRDAEGKAALEAFLEHGADVALEKKARSLLAPPEKARSLPAPPKKAYDKYFPKFEITTLDGERLTTQELRGKVVLIDFWASWCGPCKAAVPHLRRLAKRRADEPFVLLGVSADGDENALRSFLAKHKMSWPQHWDPRGELCREVFRVRSYPTYVLVNHEGRIVYRKSGWSMHIGRSLNQAVKRAIRAANEDSGALAAN